MRDSILNRRCRSSLLLIALAGLLATSGVAVAAVPASVYVMPSAPELTAAGFGPDILLAAKQTEAEKAAEKLAKEQAKEAEKQAKEAAKAAEKQAKEDEKEAKKQAKLEKKCAKHPDYKKCPASIS